VLLIFVQQRGRLLSAPVRSMWLAVFAAGFYNVFGVSIFSTGRAPIRAHAFD
jgi:hypothetical protein